MITVTFYRRRNDLACDMVERLLAEVHEVTPFQWVKVDIDSDATLKSVFGSSVPMIKTGPYVIQGDITREKIEMTLGAARDREAHIQRLGDERDQARYQRGRTLSMVDRVTGWLSLHYLFLFNTVMLLYVGLPFLAPILMKYNATLPARVIYTIYSPLCHQLAFRSWFLFGEQAFYPRELAETASPIPYEALPVAESSHGETDLNFVSAARAFLGNDTVGYKVALCERDVAIYGGIFIFGLIFAITNRKIKQISWVVWLGLGLIPIAIDGASQLPGLIAGLPNWLPLRESTPFWRTLTGGLFGVLSAWYLYPLIDETMKDARALILSKKEVISQTGSNHP